MTPSQEIDTEFLIYIVTKDVQITYTHRALYFSH